MITSYLEPSSSGVHWSLLELLQEIRPPLAVTLQHISKLSFLLSHLNEHTVYCPSQLVQGHSIPKINMAVKEGPTLTPSFGPLSRHASHPIHRLLSGAKIVLGREPVYNALVDDCNGKVGGNCFCLVFEAGRCANWFDIWRSLLNSITKC